VRASPGGAVAGALVLALYAGVAWHRFLDGDEGFYLVAARLVGEGKHLYRDFFFLQMPALPHVVAGWLALVGSGWHEARMLAATLAGAIGVLVYVAVLRSTGRRSAAASALVLFAGSGFSLGWFTTVKTYGLGEVLLLGAVLAGRSKRPSTLVLCGLLLGLATSVRLYLGVVGFAVAIHLARDLGRSRALVRAMLAVAAGVLLGLAPCAPFLLRDGDAFLFDTFRFHALRYPEGGESLFGEFGQKVETLLSVLGLRASEGPCGIQFLVLVLAGVAMSLAKGSPRNSLVRSVWILLGLVSFLPNPTFNQYFCLVVPFLAIGVVEDACALGVPSTRLARGATAVLVLYAIAGLADADRFVRTGVRVPGIEEPANAAHWSIPTVEEVARTVDRQGRDEGTSWWPGYFAFTRTPIRIEMANDFAIRAAPKLSAAQRARYHIPSYEEIGRGLERGSPPLFVEGNWSPPGFDRVLRALGYRPEPTPDGTRVWVHPGRGG